MARLTFRKLGLDFILTGLVYSLRLLSSLLLLPIILQRIGVEAYGLVQLANSTVIACLLLLDLGCQIWGAREVAQKKGDPQIASEVARLVTTIRLLFSIPAILLCCGLLLTNDLARTQPLIVVAAIMLLMVQGHMPMWLFSSLGISRRLRTAELFGTSIYIAGVPLLVQAAQDAWLIILLTACTYLPGLVLGCLTLKRTISSPLYVRAAEVRATLWKTLPFVVGLITITNFPFLVTILLGHMLPPQKFGLYAFSDRLLSIITGFLWLGGQILLPYLSSALQSRRRFLTGVGAVVAVTTIVASTIYLLAEHIAFFFGKNAFLPASELLRVMCWMLIPNALTGLIFVNALALKNKERAVTYIGLATSALMYASFAIAASSDANLQLLAFLRFLAELAPSLAMGGLLFVILTRQARQQAKLPGNPSNGL